MKKLVLIKKFPKFTITNTHIYIQVRNENAWIERERE